MELCPTGEIHFASIGNVATIEPLYDGKISCNPRGLNTVTTIRNLLPWTCWWFVTKTIQTRESVDVQGEIL